MDNSDFNPDEPFAAAMEEPAASADSGQTAKEMADTPASQPAGAQAESPNEPPATAKVDDDSAAQEGSPASQEDLVAQTLESLWKLMLTQPATADGQREAASSSAAVGPAAGGAPSDPLSALEKAVEDGDLETVSRILKEAREAAKAEQERATLRQRVYYEVLADMTRDILGGEEPTTQEKAVLMKAALEGAEAYRQALLNLAATRAARAKDEAARARVEARASELQRVGEKARAGVTPEMPPAQATEEVVIQPGSGQTGYDLFLQILAKLDEERHVAPKL